MFCRTCRGPAGAGFARCYQCNRALSEVGGLLADAVAPVGYAVRGGALADDLRRYKSEHAPVGEAAAATVRLRGLLAGFLAAHGDALWAAAGMAGGPAAVAVVPTGQGRPGAHPLTGLVRSCVPLPLVRLAVEPSEIHDRGVNPRWIRVGDPVAGSDVLVVDDTWVSGGSAQSAAAALKLAGARRVAIIVLGRHLNPGDAGSAALLAALRAEKLPFPAVPQGTACSSAGRDNVWTARTETAMQYALLIYTKPGTIESLSPAEREEVSREYWALRDEPGVLGGAGLQPVTAATTVRLADGQPLVTDGPFAETKEVFGGYYLFEADNLDEAIELAGRLPTLRLGGAVEVRPVLGKPF